MDAPERDRAGGKNAVRARDVEIALSGGGTRAAAFGLGALLYVLEAKKSSSLRQISSVSGGSITNAFVANTWTDKRGNNSDLTPDDLRVLGRRLAKNGLPLERIGRQFGQLIVFLCLLIAFCLLAIVVVLVTPVIKPAWALESVWVFVPLTGAVLVFGYLLLCARLIRTTLWVVLTKWIQYATTPTEPDQPLPTSPELISLLLMPTEEKLERYGWKAAPGHTVRKLVDLKALEGQRKTPVIHVITATDLKHGEHLHFMQNGLVSSTYGPTDPGDVRLDEAVAASAAFPGGLPATRIALKRLRLLQGTTVGDTELVLVDGGVRDNLGHAFDSYVTRASDLVTSTLAPDGVTDFVIVVDASAPRGVADLSESFLAKVPIVNGFDQVANFPRVVGVMNQSNSEARSLALAATLQSAGLGVVVSIKQSPIVVCRSVMDDPRGVIGMAAADIPVADLSSHERLSRAAAALECIRERSGLSDAEWEGIRIGNSQTATTLSSLELEQAARLIMHGYVSTMCSAHIEKDWPMLDPELWRLDRFLKWVDPSEPAANDEGGGQGEEHEHETEEELHGPTA